jgi:hypothetical protein
MHAEDALSLQKMFCQNIKMNATPFLFDDAAAGETTNSSGCTTQPPSWGNGK